MNQKGIKKGSIFSNKDAGVDKKFEGYSNLKGAHDQTQRRIQSKKAEGAVHEMNDDLIVNLQKQIVIMETEIKLLKEREVDQKNKASGYETLLRDGIPLNEHFLALKNKYNNEKDLLDKQVEIQENEIKKEELSNKQRNHKIEILKREYEDINQKFIDYKKGTQSRRLDLEFKLYTE